MIFREIRSVEALEVCLDVFRESLNADSWEGILTASAAAGSLECFELALGRAGIPLDSVEYMSHSAAISGNVEMLKRVYAVGVEFSDFDLISAIEAGNLEMCQYIVDIGYPADYSVPRREYVEQWTALMQGAARGGSMVCFDMLLERSGLAIALLHGLSSEAAAGGNLALLQQVREAGVRDKIRDLYEAVMAGHFDICEYLINAGDPIDFTTRMLTYGLECGPLWWLATKEPGLADRQICKLFLKHNVDINWSYDHGANLVSFTVERGRSDLARIYVELGANVSLSDVICRFAFDSDLVRWLVQERGHDVNTLIPDEPNGYAVTVAASRGSLEALKLLVDLKADPDVCGGQNGLTPLCAAIVNGPGFACFEDELVSILDFLLDCCPSLATRSTKCGATPLALVNTFVDDGFDRERLVDRLHRHGAGTEWSVSADWLVRVGCGSFGHGVRIGERCAPTWRWPHAGSDSPHPG